MGRLEALNLKPKGHPMRTKTRYVFANGKSLIIEHHDFGLYAIVYDKTLLKELYSKDQAYSYFSKAIGIIQARTFSKRVA